MWPVSIFGEIPFLFVLFFLSPSLCFSPLSLSFCYFGVQEDKKVMQGLRFSKPCLSPRRSFVFSHGKPKEMPAPKKRSWQGKIPVCYYFPRSGKENHYLIAHHRRPLLNISIISLCFWPLPPSHWSCAQLLSDKQVQTCVWVLTVILSCSCSVGCWRLAFVMVWAGLANDKTTDALPTSHSKERKESSSLTGFE